MDVYEVELKVRAKHDAVREALPEAAEYLGVVEQVDTYFDAPHREFAETDEALRLRRERRIGADPSTAVTAPSASDADAPAAGHGERPTASDERPSTVGTEAAGSASDDAGWVTEVTYKGPLLEADSKSREEFETAVADGESLGTILERLGFSPTATVHKERERYAVDDVTVTLDAVDGLGEFVEVELEQEGADIEDARERGRELLEELGCAPDEQIRTSYLGLLLEAAD